MFRLLEAVFCRLFMLAPACLALTAQAQSPGETPVAGDPIDVSYVTPGAAFAVVAHPDRMLLSSQMELMPIEILSALGKQYLGIDPIDIEQIVVVAEPRVGAGVVVRLSRPCRWSAIRSELRHEGVEEELAGRPIMRTPMRAAPSVYMPDEQTLIVVKDSLLQGMLANHASPVAGPVSEMLDQYSTTDDVVAVFDVEPVRDRATIVMLMAPLSRDFVNARALPRLIDSLQFRIRSASSGRISIVADAVDDSSAQQLEVLVDELLVVLRVMAMEEIGEEARNEDPVDRAAAKYGGRMLDHFLASVQRFRDGKRLELSCEEQSNGQAVTVRALVALLLAAVQKSQETSRRLECSNNLKQLARAIHSYYAVEGHLPPRAITDQVGKPLLSWRVLLLPYLDAKGLYDEFHLDEPWDSPRNIKLVERMPPMTFACPSAQLGPGKTIYLVPMCEDALIGDSDETTFADVTDGASATIMVLEANPDQAVIWTKPADHEIDLEDPREGLFGGHQDVGYAMFCDGSVMALKPSISVKTFRTLLTKSGGEAVPLRY